MSHLAAVMAFLALFNFAGGHVPPFDWVATFNFGMAAISAFWLGRLTA